MNPLTSSVMKRFLAVTRRLAYFNPGSARLCALFVSVLGLPLGTQAVDAAKTFATPDDAANAFTDAVKSIDPDKLRSILGPEAEDLENPDRVQATNEFHAVAEAIAQSTRLVRDSDTQYELELGTNSWPFPIPIVQRDGRWFFDTAAGKEELLNRRIGKNELEVLQTMRSYVVAQREYATRDRNGNGVLEYAQKLNSSPGKTDGLYWPPDLNGELSPLGPMVAEAQSVGYFGDLPESDGGPQPFYGYFFKILTRQGKHAQGGKQNYINKGHMTGGFALLAWPADYGDSGVMTFIVNQDGKVYQKDLGEKTAKLASGIKDYDPDSSWTLSPD
jgi:hypothetical protein